MVSNYYIKEKEGIILKGVITCGSKVGYNGKEEIDYEKIVGILEKSHKSIEDIGMKPIPCVISRGELIMKTNKGNYKEKVYFLNFSSSPRFPMDKKTFYNTLIEYINIIGYVSKQERIYLEFNNKTIVFKIK